MGADYVAQIIILKHLGVRLSMATDLWVTWIGILGEGINFWKYKEKLCTKRNIHFLVEPANIYIHTYINIYILAPLSHFFPYEKKARIMRLDI